MVAMLAVPRTMHIREDTRTRDGFVRESTNRFSRHVALMMFAGAVHSVDISLSVHFQSKKRENSCHADFEKKKKRCAAKIN